MTLNDFLGKFEDGGHKVEVSRNEAIMLDWILTAHAWDEHVIGELKDNWRELREKVGRVIVGHATTLSLNDEELDILLVTTPILFSIGTQEVGSELKTKLWECVVGARPKKPEPSKMDDFEEPYYGNNPHSA